MKARRRASGSPPKQGHVRSARTSPGWKRTSPRAGLISGFEGEAAWSTTVPEQTCGARETSSRGGGSNDEVEDRAWLGITSIFRSLNLPGLEQDAELYGGPLSAGVQNRRSLR